MENPERVTTRGYSKALELLHECSRKEGFLASPTKQENYRRIWWRDGVIVGLAAWEFNNSVDRYISEVLVPDSISLLPAFHPVIKPVDRDWEDLKITFSYRFKNRPCEFHNGGLWPMITGFYCADLAQRGELPSAREFLGGIHAANAMEMEGEAWGFPEYVHGREFTPKGTRCQCWSAAAAVMGHQALEGKRIFRIT
jgi:hypothetical protein